MTTSRADNLESTTPNLSPKYEQATPDHTSRAQQPFPAGVSSSSSSSSSSSTGAVAPLPLANTVFASSDEIERKVTVDPIRIKRSLDSIRKNRMIRDKGLG